MSRGKPISRKAGETDAAYITRLETSNAALRQHNAELSKWAGKVGEAVTALSVEASTAFQAMAEKAKVRSHPSVTEAVRLFDAISHPQWTPDDTKFCGVDFPQDWDFDAPDAWSGDADMTLNAPIAAALEYFRAKTMSSSADERECAAIHCAGLEKALEGLLGQVKEASGFTPVKLSVPPNGHCNDMTREQLVELVKAMGWMALDIAQDLDFANFMLRRDLRASAYRSACASAYALSSFAYDKRDELVNVKVMGDVAPF